MSYETCFLCDAETGRAGAGDDSIYDELGKGPYCIECYNRQIPARLRTLNELSVTDDAAEEIDTLRARVAELEAEATHLTPWKDAIIDGLVVGHIYNLLHETNAKVALNALISWETSIALDPLVSSEAQSLVDRGRSEAANDNQSLRARVAELEAHVHETDALLEARRVYSEALEAQIAAHEKKEAK